MHDQYTVGEMKTVIIPDPGAGNNFSYTVPAGVRLKLYGVAFNYETSATVAARRITITVTDPDGGLSAFMIAGGSQAENITNNYYFANGNNSNTLAINTSFPAPMAYSIILTPGDVIASVINNIKIADALTKVYLKVERFILP